MLPSLIFEDFDVERFTVVPRFADYLFGDIMMMNIDGAHDKFRVQMFNVQSSKFGMISACRDFSSQQ